MGRNLYLLLALLFMTNWAMAQTGELQGKVTDAATGDGIPYANIAMTVSGTTQGTQTDFDGFYTIKPLPPGQYDVKISFVGYQDQQIEGVLVAAEKITFLDVELKEASELLEAFVVTAYEVPILQADKTSTGATVTKEQIKSLPTRNVQSIASQASGVYQEDEGSGVNVKGSRSESTDYYIDGIKVRGSANLPASAIEQLTVVTGGVPAKYGDATGGIINITTRGPSNQFSGGLELISSNPFDPYGYYLGNFSLSGPLLRLKDKAGNKRPVMGFFLAGEYLHEDDDDPSAIGVYRAKEDVLANIKANPLVRSATATGFDKAVDFVTLDDLEKVDIKQNVEKDQLSIAGKIDIQPSNNITLTLGGTFNYNRGGTADRGSGTKAFMRRYDLFNTEHMPEYTRDVYRGYVRFTQRFGSKKQVEGEETKQKASLLQNAYYRLQFDYTKSRFNAQDPVFQDRIFEYGHVGKFTVDRTPIYAQSQVGNLQGLEFQGFQESNVNYSSEGVANVDRAAYNDQYFELAGDDRDIYYNSLNSIQRNNGLLNGSVPSSIFSSYALWYTPGTPYGLFQTFQGDQYRLSLNSSFDLKRPGSSDRNKHAIEFGFEYEQRVDRDFNIFPTSIWNTMSNRVSQPGAGGIVRDLDNPILVIGGQEYSVQEYQNLQNSGSDITFDSNDTIKYNYIRNEEQPYFDRKFREKFGYGDLDFVDVDAHAPSEYSLDMFSPDELFNGGGGASILGDVYGYDYSGNLLSSKPSFNDYWTAKDETGEIFTRLQDAFRPIYTAGYIQDKFSFRDLIFNIGVRVDRFDANQKTPKDLYSPLYATFKAGEVAQINGNAVSHPSTIGEDYVVYVDNEIAPTRVVGYRDGTQWYTAEGAATSDPRELQGTGGTIAPYLAAPLSDNPKDDIRKDGYNPDLAFEDYKPQVSVMPRIAFSFEISEAAIFFAHYDVLSQRPQSRISTRPYDYYFFEANSLAGAFNNANLKPETTVDYQIGFKQKVSNTSGLTISGFYRELKDMVQIQNIPFAYPSTYNTYGNIDFGTVKGLEVAYDLRRTGNVRLTANYTMQFADGTGSGDASQANLIDFGQPNLRTILPLDYDARHLLNINFDYRYGNNEGPKLFGRSIFANAGFNLILRGRSGTPYTKQAQPTPEAQFGVPTRQELEGSINGSRLPWNIRLDSRIEKDFKFKIGKGAAKVFNVYFLIQNLLNTDNVVNVYSFTGSADDDGYVPSALGQQAVAAQVNKEAFTEQYQVKVNNPNNYSIPRRMRLGMSFGF